MNHFVTVAEQEVQDWLGKSDKCLNEVVLKRSQCVVRLFEEITNDCFILIRYFY